MLRRAAVVLALAAALLAGCADDRRESAERYLQDANAIQRRSAPAFERAQRAYAEFSRGQVPSAPVQEALAEAEESIRATRAELARLRPPAEAEPLHGRLLGVYDLNAGLARETALLGRYLPASTEALRPLPGVTRRLRRGLAAEDPEAQERALDRYASTLDEVVADMRALRPPPLLRASHDAQVAQLESAQELAEDLPPAIRSENAKRVARLLLRFRRANAPDARQDRLAERALEAYNRRYRAVTRAQAEVQRERRRLEESLSE